MYNSKQPTEAELPSSITLIKSTIAAIILAIVMLVVVILPAEYGIDPTGAGHVLGLTSMGEIKEKLADEAEADRLQAQQSVIAEPEVVTETEVVQQEPIIAVSWRDEESIVLEPGQGAEVKLTMQQGQTAEFLWVSEGGPVNFDTHGDARGKSISYEKGRGVPEDSGELVAAFSGNHGWFFRNRNKANVTVTLKTRGEYSSIKRVL